MAFKILKGSKQELENRLDNIKLECLRYIDKMQQENGKIVLVLPQVKNGGKSKQALEKILHDGVNQLKFNILSLKNAMNVYEIFVSRIRYGLPEIISNIEIHYNEFPSKFILTTEPDFKCDNIGYVTDNLELVLNGAMKTVIVDMNEEEIKFVTEEKMLEFFGVEERKDLVKMAVIAGTRHNGGLGGVYLREILERGYKQEELERLMEENNLKGHLARYEI